MNEVMRTFLPIYEKIVKAKGKASFKRRVHERKKEFPGTLQAQESEAVVRKDLPLYRWAQLLNGSVKGSSRVRRPKPTI